MQDQAFVPIGHLVAGSQVLTTDYQTKTITSILPRPGPAQQVYNLEVNGEHVYYVGEQLLLAHNNGCDDFVRYMTQAEYDDFLSKGQRLAGQAGHRGPKRLIDPSFDGMFKTDIGSLNSGVSVKNRYAYKVVVKGNGNLRAWMTANARNGDNLTSTFGHPDTWEVPTELLAEMHEFIKSFEVSKIR